jgi:DNA-binding transcriptional regulator YdaS (Cro superfamily)
MARKLKTDPRDPIIDQAVAVAGGATKLAHALGCTVQAIWLWDKVPMARVPSIAALTGIPRHELRPDMYEAPGKEAAA